MPPRFVPPPIVLTGYLLIGCGALAGCGGEEDPISVYTVPALDGDALPDDTPTDAAAAAPAVPPATSSAPFTGGMAGVQTPEEPRRLLAALATAGGEEGSPEAFWFFKLAGPVAAVEAAEPAFRQWLESVSLEGKAPDWTVPDGWTERPGGGMRFATLLVPRGLEVTVTTFGVRGSLEDRIEANLIRWRDQVGATGDAGEVEEVTLADGSTATLLSVSSPETAGTPDGSAPAKPQASVVPFTYELPEGWTETPPAPMSRLSFRTGGEEAAATVTVGRFPAGAMTLDQVAGIWRGQAGTAEGVPPADAAPLTVGGEEAARIGLPPKQPGGPTVLGAALTRGEALWLFKLVGDEPAVAAATPAFERFLAGVRFPDSPSEGE